MPSRPLEILNLLAAGLLAALTAWCATTGLLPQWPLILARSLAMAAAVLVLARLARREERLSPAMAVLVNYYPLAFVPLVFDTIGYVIPIVSPADRDAALIAIDRALFGVHPTLWLERFIWPPLVDLFYIGYATYYFFPLVVGLALWRKDRTLARAFVFMMVFAFYLSYVGYFLVPAKGPRTAQADQYTVPLNQTAISRAIADTLNRLENTKDDAFPSGHTMVTVICMGWAFLHARRAFWALLPAGLLLIGATMYCRYHYVFDVLVGLALAAVTPPLAMGLYRLLGRQRSADAQTARPAAGRS